MIRKTSLLFVVTLIVTSTILAQNLPIETSILFSGSGNCVMCHSANQTTFLTKAGKDISPIFLWRATMMANAAKDPLWQAKVTAEVAELPALQSVIEDKCTTCHMPMRKTEVIYHGVEHFTLQEGQNVPLSMDGVSCTLCHQIQNTNLGEEKSFSGGFQITNAHDIFGPYQFPTSMPMINQSGYEPVHSAHVNDSELCATCHTLFTPFVDNQGNVAGTFPEQTPYLEWQNSIYSDQGTECQTCHMPAVAEAIKIASTPPWLTTLRNPIWKHDFVGANVFMLDLLNENRTEIGINAYEENFDSTRAQTLNILQNESINLTAAAKVHNDTLFLDVLVENLSGHKFPTGFPSRRAWLHIKVTDDQDEVLFESGKWDETGEILGIDPNYEPHHKDITDPNQVQIYQPVMTDIDGNVTHTLLRGAAYIKDNRLPPKGFKKSFTGYEDIKIAGNAENDENFNRDQAGNEGNGGDLVMYKIPICSQSGNYKINICMMYQTLSPKFAQDLFTHETEKVIQFKVYYDSAKKDPVLIKSILINTSATGVKNKEENNPSEYSLFRNYPNPFNQSTRIKYSSKTAGNVTLQVYDIQGRMIKTLLTGYLHPGIKEITWDGTDEIGADLASGVYVAVLKEMGSVSSHRMPLLR
jgi:hypothetical protein